MTTLNEKFYREIRCPICRALLGYEYVFAGRLAFNCWKCKELIEFNFKHTQTKENKDIIKEFSIQNTENNMESKGGE